LGNRTCVACGDVDTAVDVTEPPFADELLVQVGAIGNVISIAFCR